MAWAGLAGDVVDVVVPFVSGVGEATKAVGAVADAADAIDDVYDAAKAIDRADDAIDLVDDASDATKAINNLDLDGSYIGGYCFIAGTLVLTEDGNRVIEEVEVGDYVWAADPKTGELARKQVVQLFRNQAEELTHVFVQGEEIICTPGHPFYSPQYGWIDACELETGDILVLPDGNYVLVEYTYTEQLNEPVAIYNFEVQDFHTYFVGNCSILVHNRNCSKNPDASATIPKEKTEIHHIVEQCQEKKSGFSREMIQADSNKVELPYSVHRKISGYYSSKQDFTGGLRVRDWLSGQSFEQQTIFGWKVIKQMLK